jgi:hypothetical protein
MSSDGRRAGSAQHRVSPVATGLAVFAGALMIVSGIGAVFEGIARCSTTTSSRARRSSSTRST